MEKKLTWEELKKVAIAAKEKGIIKAQPVNIPKNHKYDRITIAKTEDLGTIRDLA